MELAPVAAMTTEREATLEAHGVRLPFDPKVVTPKIEKQIRRGRYEGGEAAALRAHVGPGDSVLELGGGLGLLSTIAARIEGVRKVVTVEANPEMIAVIAQTHRLNGVANVSVINGMVGTASAPARPFYVRSDFWASSFAKGPTKYDRVAQVRCYALSELVRAHRPSVIVSDIEGAELDVFADADLTGVHTVILEVHDKVYGYAGRARLSQSFARLGFEPVAKEKSGSIVVYTRAGRTASEVMAEAATLPRKIAIVTCMKDEGPFILEWIAFHRAIGVTDFIVFSNDCTDGSDALLDRLDEMGIVTHLPNPARATGSTFFQPVALAYAPLLRPYREADAIISIDVDEFINVRVGDGTLEALFQAAGPFHALSMSEVNFGTGGIGGFTPGLLSATFTDHQTLEPGKNRARRGVKTITRAPSMMTQIRNHRPDLRPELADYAIWLDGSGRPLPDLLDAGGENGCDCRGRYDLVALNHYALRSIDSLLVKRRRGDVVVAEKVPVSQRYFRQRNLGGSREVALAARAGMIEAALEVLLADRALAALHAECVRRHQEIIAELHRDPGAMEARAWMEAIAAEQEAKAAAAAGEDTETDAEG